MDSEAINPGSSLTPTINPSWPGQYAFGFYKQGNGYAVGIFFARISQKIVVWIANRDNAPVAADVSLNFTSDGRMVLQSAQGKEIINVVNFVGAVTSAASAFMLDTGNFVFVSESNHSTGLFRALMQQDGYLALYPIGTLYTIQYGYLSKPIGAQNTTTDPTLPTKKEDVGPRSFTYAELERMTDNFKEELGRGAFGIVYKGAIGNGTKFVAVKKLEKLLADPKREFHTEMKVIGRTHHKNLIRLLGYCHDGLNRHLVYEYMSNGSLAEILFTPKNKPCWDERIEIACNVAKGILYLHEDCVPQIIHCDIKPQNILMDENMCAKISDFGLAKLLKPDQTKTLTGIRGTRGYVAPEWHRKVPHVTVKVDVYSFGIVLLEIICCRKSVDSNLPEKEAILEEWTFDCFEHAELSKLVNDEEVDNSQLERMVKVALWCILDDPSLRPSMKKVLLMLLELWD
uniref:non-specific serine/threonine protein kinase n=1 Tax=Fagus sylvatica TaxID=28930 RepID=A0A2N9EW15_FAGSY